MSREVGPEGPRTARIMIVGEAPGKDEEEAGRPFVGASGRLLDRMLAEVGINRSQCYITNVCRVRPPGNKIEAFLQLNRRVPVIGQPVKDGLEKLLADIQDIKPDVIIPLGGTALWATTGYTGIEDWAGSQISRLWDRKVGWVIPTYHPAAILRDWSLRNIVMHDLRKAAAISQGRIPEEPHRNFQLRPSYEAVVATLEWLTEFSSEQPLFLAVDIETYKRQHIACIGLAWSKNDAICIPLMSVDRASGYWTAEQEVNIVRLLREVLTDPDIQIIGQNFSYDAQYIARFWGVLVKPWFDTMTAQHVCWPGTPKGLDYLSHLYCPHHVYWKHLGKEWKPGIPEEQLWHYNCLDCVKTFEVHETLNKLVDKLGLREPFDFQQSLFEPVVKMMLRGIRFDVDRQAELSKELDVEMARCLARLEKLCGHTLNPRSPIQLKHFFYDDLHLEKVYHRKTGLPKLDEEALTKLGKREPIVKPIVEEILNYRSAGVYRSTFIGVGLEADNRVRCSFKMDGTETFRFSSSEDAFGHGMNLQNVPTGEE